MLRIIEEKENGTVVCIDREGFFHIFSNREEMVDYLNSIREW